MYSLRKKDYSKLVLRSDYIHPPLQVAERCVIVVLSPLSCGSFCVCISLFSSFSHHSFACSVLANCFNNGCDNVDWGVVLGNPPLPLPVMVAQSALRSFQRGYKNVCWWQEGDPDAKKTAQTNHENEPYV